MSEASKNTNKATENMSEESKNTIEASKNIYTTTIYKDYQTLKTKIMKKLFYLLLLIAGVVNGQIVNIPDANFKAKLIASGIDTNADGEIQVSEALSTTNYLDIQNSNIVDLTGLSSFTNLSGLNCSFNQISVLDCSNLTNLNTLDCSNNLITNLDLSNFSNIGMFFCNDNQLTNLTLSNISINSCRLSNNNLSSLILNNASFGQLYCENNNLTTLDLTSTTIFQLYCANNELSNLIMANNSISFELHCENNLLSNLNLNNSSIAGITCGNNLFTTLDFSNCTNLTNLLCNDLPTLLTLYIKNGANESVSLAGDINLEFICADDSQLITLQSVADSLGAILSTYCTFTPGGNYNKLNGIVRFDSSNNGCDSSDVPMEYLSLGISLNGVSTDSSIFTNNFGNFSLYMSQAGTYTLNSILENPNYFNVSPISINATTINNSTSFQEICITPNGIHPDLEIVLAPVTPARPGFDAVYKVVYKNKGNQTLSGNVYFYYDDTILDFVSASGTPVQSLGLLTWTYADLLPFEARSFLVTLNVNSPIETPAVNIGDQLILNAATDPVDGNEVTFSLTQTVVGSFDPNDITCLEGETVSPSEIGNYLHYMVNFENTGNYAAENVVVKIEIDTNKFDVSSLQLLESSNPVDARITGNKAEFIFKNIQLAGPGGHGNILLKIKSKNNLVTGDMVSKNANIYFDYNAPITTLPADTVFQTLGLNNPILDNSVTVFPNPTNNFVNIKSKNTIQSVQVFDVQGRLLQTNLNNQKETKIDLSDKSNGVYFFKITSDIGIKIEKIVKK